MEMRIVSAVYSNIHIPQSQLKGVHFGEFSTRKRIIRAMKNFKYGLLTYVPVFFLILVLVGRV